MIKINKGMSLALLMLLLVAGCNRDRTDGEYVDQAKHYQDSGELAKASIELKNALRVNPENGEARRLLGLLYLTIGNGESAEKELRRAVELKVSYQAVALPILQAVYLQHDYRKMLQQMKMPEGLDRETQVEWLVLRGRAQLEMGKLAEARGEFSAAARVAPDSHQAQLGRALDAFFSKNYLAADGYLDAALARNPRFAEALTLKGDVRYLQGRLTEAEVLYTQAIDARRNNSADVYKRARVRLEVDNLAEAESDIKMLTLRVPNSPEVQFLRGVFEMRNGRLESAEAALRDADRLRQGNAETQYYLAVVLGLRHQPQQARAILESIVNRQPGNYLAARQLSGIYLQQGNFEDAQKLLKVFAAEKAGDADFLEMYGNTLLRTGGFEDALKSAQALRQIEPESERSNLLLGNALLSTGRYEEAIACLDRAIARNSDRGTADALKVKALTVMGKLSEALTVADAWVTRRPQDVDALLAVAEVSRRLGNAENARKSYEAVLRLQKNNNIAMRGLAQLDLADQKLVDAQMRYEELWKQSPGDIEAALFLAREDSRHGNATAGVEKLELAIDRNPEDVRPRLALGRHYLDVGRPGQVIAVLRPKEDRFGSDPGWLALMVEALLAQGSADSAKNMLDRLDAVQDSDGIGAYWRAQIYSMTGQDQLVLGQLEKAYRSNPNDLRFGIAMFRRYGQMGAYDKANELIMDLSRRAPGNVEIMAQRGWLAVRQGKYQDAVKFLTDALAQLPSRELMIELARAQVSSGHVESAIDVLKSGLVEMPTDVLLVRELTEIYTVTGQTPMAVAIMRNAVAQGLRDPVILNNLAWLLKKDDPQAALAFAEQAADLAPKSGGIMDTVGQILMEQGQRERGLRALAEAVRLSENDIGIRLHYAEALSVSRQNVQASKEIKAIEALLGDDNDESARMARKRISEIKAGLKY
ncbi:MAG: PEP-CTERM system TPR-repeat protein PrsT [Nitrospira sp.]|nr:PEP-CTERM system TPR-repeat protein PrsT [Nitrospira sp.]